MWPYQQSQGIAEHGIIEAIEMHHFMCHKYLTFSFGPQINFIIGASAIPHPSSPQLLTWIQGTMEVRYLASFCHARHSLS
jgi:hypothetical protein